MGPIFNFPEFDLVCRLGLQPYRARAGRSKSGPSRQTRSNATFRVKIEISGPKLENHNTLTPLNLNDIGIESIFGRIPRKALENGLPQRQSDGQARNKSNVTHFAAAVLTAMAAGSGHVRLGPEGGPKTGIPALDVNPSKKRALWVSDDVVFECGGLC